VLLFLPSKREKKGVPTAPQKKKKGEAASSFLFRWKRTGVANRSKKEKGRRKGRTYSQEKEKAQEVGKGGGIATIFSLLGKKKKRTIGGRVMGGKGGRMGKIGSIFACVAEEKRRPKGERGREKTPSILVGPGRGKREKKARSGPK